MFNDNTWNLLFENIVTRFAESDYGIIASMWGDFTIFSIYYLSRIDKDKIKALFDCLCKTHESLSSANGRVKIKEERKKAGLTQEEFAMRSGLGLRFVRELEQGKETVRMDKVNQALAMFGKEAVPGEKEE